MRLAGASYHEIIAATGIYRSAACLNTFFSNTAYRGEVHFGGSVIPIEPVVTPDEWRRVESMRRNKASDSHPRRVASVYLLSGLLTCGHCGGAMVGSQSNAKSGAGGYWRKDWRYYICARRHNRRDCDMPRVNARNLEAAIVNFLMERVLTEEALARYADQLASTLEAERPAMEAQLASLLKERRHLKDRIEKLLDAVEDGTGGDSVAGRLREREGELTDVDRHVESLEERLKGLSGSASWDVTELRTQLREALDQGPRQEARRLVAAIIEEVIVDEEVLRVRYHYPFRDTAYTRGGPTRIRTRDQPVMSRPLCR